MKYSQKILLVGGLVLAILGMAYGFWYAVADEHPTLERMGVSLASAFAEVANGDMEQARESLDVYAATRFEYIREVHTHGHLAALSTMLILLGLFFNQLGFAERTRSYLASLLVFGTAALPLGAFLEIILTGPLPNVIAVLGTIAIIGGMFATAFGFLRSSDTLHTD
jgi:hypothetical protein